MVVILSTLCGFTDYFIDRYIPSSICTFKIRLSERYPYLMICFTGNFLKGILSNKLTFLNSWF